MIRNQTHCWWYLRYLQCWRQYHANASFFDRKNSILVDKIETIVWSCTAKNPNINNNNDVTILACTIHSATGHCTLQNKKATRFSVLNFRSCNSTEWFLSLKVDINRSKKYEKRTLGRFRFSRGTRWRN